MGSAVNHPAVAGRACEKAGQENSPSFLSKLFSAFQFFLALGVTLAFLAYLYWSGLPKQEKVAAERPKDKPLVETIAGGKIRVEPGTPLAQRLQVVEVKRVKITQPLISVTGTVAASYRDQAGKNQLQFNSADVLSIYSDWTRAKGDVEFATTQLTAVTDLGKARKGAQQKALDRLEKLVQAGTDSEKDLATARADLLLGEIQARKELHEASSALLVAKRNEIALARQLQQAGLEPDLLAKMDAGIDVVMADVPEIWYAQVKIGQGCEARFFGLQGKTFKGRVLHLPPVVTKDRRSLRVLFTIDDPDDLLRPGMFAEIDIDTDPRDVLMMPSEGIIHIGRADFVLVGTQDPAVWQPREVLLGIAKADRTEVLSGIRDADRVLGAGAILLKPLMVELQPAPNSPKAVVPDLKSAPVTSAKPSAGKGP